MKKIRAKITRKELHNRWDNSQSTANTTEQHHYLTDDDGIETHEIEHVQSLQCGHLAEPFALCSECSGVICSACFTACEHCSKPLGPCHAKKGANGVWLCRMCSKTQQRKRRMRFLLSPFVRFDDEKSDL